jgi:hypothetical protein
MPSARTSEGCVCGSAEVGFVVIGTTLTALLNCLLPPSASCFRLRSPPFSPHLRPNNYLIRKAGVSARYPERVLQGAWMCPSRGLNVPFEPLKGMVQETFWVLPRNLLTFNRLPKTQFSASSPFEYARRKKKYRQKRCGLELFFLFLRRQTLNTSNA